MKHLFWPFVFKCSPWRLFPIALICATSSALASEQEEVPLTETPPSDGDDDIWMDDDAFTMDEAASFETVVKAPPLKKETTSHKLTREEFTRIPGTSGDIVKSVTTLPGVGQTFDGEAGVIVRGSPPADTGYYVNGINIPLTFHGDMTATSIFNEKLLASMEFYPGNFSVQYGDAMGGIINITPKTLDSDQYLTQLDSNLRYSGFSVEGPIGKHWQWAGAGRHSYSIFDKPFRDAFHPDDPSEYTYRFYDYQSILQYHKPGKRKVTLFIFGTDDESESKVEFPELDYKQHIQKKFGFHKIQLARERKWGDNVTNQLQMALEYQRTEPDLLGYQRFILKAVPFYLRDELHIAASDNVRLRLGLDAKLGYAWWEVTNFGGQRYDGSTPFAFPGTWLELEYYPVKKLTTISGVRVSLAPRIMTVAVDPRFAVRYQFKRGTVFKGGFGIFHQPPADEDQDKDYGNENLEMQRAIHYSAGVEQQFFEHIHLNMEGFYRNLSNGVVQTDEIRPDGSPVNFDNDGQSQVLGLETMLRHTPSSHFFGWISYTLMKATSHPKGAPKLPAGFDQRHILTAVANFTFNRGFELGFKFQLATGRPYTPIVRFVQRSEYVAAQQRTYEWYEPVWGKPNSGRMPLFHQLDIRFEKRFDMTHFDWTVYLEIINVYNQRTPTYYFWVPDSTRVLEHASNHFYPNVGLTASF
ncbi:MAG: TonB-dependent receptor plug domain-containing protein [Deltaproteobacteria bacterium]|nr:TonB-dependent receptor plug domain-containing protein [Deltaproteobacteria bacterium]